MTYKYMHVPDIFEVLMFSLHWANFLECYQGYRVRGEGSHAHINKMISDKIRCY